MATRNCDTCRFLRIDVGHFQPVHRHCLFARPDMQSQHFVSGLDDLKGPLVRSLKWRSMCILSHKNEGGILKAQNCRGSRNTMRRSGHRVKVTNSLMQLMQLSSNVIGCGCRSDEVTRD